MSKNILIYGATGCLGSKIVAEQLFEGHNVFATTRNLEKGLKKQESWLDSFAREYIKRKPDKALDEILNKAGLVKTIQEKLDQDPRYNDLPRITKNPYIIDSLFTEINTKKDLSPASQKIIDYIKHDFGSRLTWTEANFSKMTDKEPHMKIFQERDIDAVVNSVGIHWDTKYLKMDDVNDRAPKAIADAILELKKVSNKDIRLVNISTLATELKEPQYSHPFYAHSRKRSDDYILDKVEKEELDAFVLPFNFAYEPNGSDPRFQVLETAARFGIAIKQKSDFTLRPINMNDAITIVSAAVNNDYTTPKNRESRWLPVAGPEKVKVDEMVDIMRVAAGKNLNH